MHLSHPGVSPALLGLGAHCYFSPSCQTQIQRRAAERTRPYRPRADFHCASLTSFPHVILHTLKCMILETICGLHCGAVRCNFLLTVLRLSQKKFHGNFAHFSPPLKSVCALRIEYSLEATDVKVMGDGAHKTNEGFNRDSEAYPPTVAA